MVNEASDEEKQSLVVHREDFWASTSNKQLNFLQHVLIRDLPIAHPLPRGPDRLTARVPPLRFHHPETTRSRRDCCSR
jgi:hypothetical protein